MTTATLSLEHLIKPSAQETGKAPVIFLLHGYGSNEEDLFSFAPELPEAYTIISVRAPYPMQPFGNAWYAINFDAQKGKCGLSGYINEQIIADDYTKNDFSNLKIYASHGQVDQVIPPEWAQRIPDFLKNLGIEHVYQEFPVGHGVAPQNFYSFKQWLIENSQ